MPWSSPRGTRTTANGTWTTPCVWYALDRFWSLHRDLVGVVAGRLDVLPVDVGPWTAPRQYWLPLCFVIGFYASWFLGFAGQWGSPRVAGIARDKSTNRRKWKWSRCVLDSAVRVPRHAFGEERTFGRVALFSLLFESVAATLGHSVLAAPSYCTCSSSRCLVMQNAVLNVSVAALAEVDRWSDSVASPAAPFGGSARFEMYSFFGRARRLHNYGLPP